MRLVSMPSNASAASAAWPPKPARWTLTPSILAMSRSSSAASGMSLHPFSPKLNVRAEVGDLPSSESRGGTCGSCRASAAAALGETTPLSVTPSIFAISAAWVSIAARSSSVRPESRW